ncbi:deoxyuridine 5'-triphosphate nucleotidohydrolase [Clostridium botulinum D/C]|nr:deoxyuridine 5'-triphosphate nucleotidohydrolase [Clostridium botulinum D/C]MCD3360815.1 deoxyuridine 5'-triphosphate nucleotidohydrolase [Clostridium botulinum D/C]MCD3362598.1 deoxyuridine 5'-triphosphate nucleotidohydrolase [Clostridium botulinum D/C]MCD3366554.1 deoxyuridine 5'-triphosphate nucleotidohydrolase [Clostridium botulinum D/C]
MEVMKKLLFLKDVEVFNKVFRKGESLDIVDKNAIMDKVKGIIVYKIEEHMNLDGVLEATQCEYFINNTMLNFLLDNKLATIDEVEFNELYFAKTKPNAIIPTKREEDAGYDVYTCETETIVIEPCSLRMIDTGIAIACNKAYFPKFFDKGGMGSKGIIVGAGVGDSGYRDSYFIPLINTNLQKTVVITTQSDEEIEKCTHFDLEQNKFVTIDSNAGVRVCEYVKKEDCIIKPINKAITQFVMLPVPTFNTKEVSWEQLKNIKSQRGLGKLGSSGK